MWKSYLSHLICLQLGYAKAVDTKVKVLTEASVVRAARGEGQDERGHELVDKYIEGHEEELMKVVWIQCSRFSPYA